MAEAAFRAITLEARDPSLVGEFWATVLDRRWQPETGALQGGPGEPPLIVVATSELAAVKNRVHLDIYTAQLQDLLDLGCTVAEPEAEGRRWTVLRDLEGGEFCAFVRPDRPRPPAPRLHGLVVDCTDYEAQANFWVDVLGGAAQIHASGYSTAADVPGLTFTLDFVPVPESKSAPNRLRWVVQTGDLGPLLAGGARLLANPARPGAPSLLADPEGNEFYVVSGSSTDLTSALFAAAPEGDAAGLLDSSVGAAGQEGRSDRLDTRRR